MSHRGEGAEARQQVKEGTSWGATEQTGGDRRLAVGKNWALGMLRKALQVIILYEHFAPLSFTWLT